MQMSTVKGKPPSLGPLVISGCPASTPGACRTSVFMLSCRMKAFDVLLHATNLTFLPTPWEHTSAVSLQTCTVETSTLSLTLPAIVSLQSSARSSAFACHLKRV